MLDTLEKMSGKTHRVFRDSKTVTRDNEAMVLQNEAKVSIQMSVKEMPVISYNDMAFISERNSIVFRAGDSPVWNRNETILPMSWRLFQNTIIQPGKEYSLQTIPTLSSALDFDVRKNQPDFIKMWEKRRLQARVASEAMEAYKTAYGYDFTDVERLDPEIYADEIMAVIENKLRMDAAEEQGVQPESFDDDEYALLSGDDYDYEDNDEQAAATQEQMAKFQDKDKARYAGGMIARNDLLGMSKDSAGVLRMAHLFDRELVEAFKNCKAALFSDTDYFTDRKDGQLWSNTGILYIKKATESASLQALNKAAKDKSSHVYAEGEIQVGALFEPTDAFYKFLAGLDSWDFAQGKFEADMARIMRGD